jgi:glycine/D-amino acid oxidase-like deaminating enzyme
MTTYDWIVIGGGITGSALSYELAKVGLKVLLLEKDSVPDNATRYSYGGLAYWSGTTELTRQLCREGIELHRNLSEELGADTEFRDIDLVLTIDRAENPQTVVQNYAPFALSPRLLSVEEACELEPLLNPKAISGALHLPHAHIHSQRTNEAYQQAFCRLGGEIAFEEVLKLVRRGNQIEAVLTPQHTYFAENTVVCAGGLSRCLLREAGIHVPLYFTHAQLIVTPPVDLQLRTLVMPATQQRFILEARATQSDMDSYWDFPSQNLIASILDPGAIQFLDGSLCIGQISQIITDASAPVDLVASETQIRTRIAAILPSLANIPGTWHRCLVAFAHHSLPLVGAIDHFRGVYLFSAFTSTLVIAPPLARHFASWAIHGEDAVLSQLRSLMD